MDFQGQEALRAEPQAPLILVVDTGRVPQFGWRVVADADVDVPAGHERVPVGLHQLVAPVTHGGRSMPATSIVVRPGRAGFYVLVQASGARFGAGGFPGEFRQPPQPVKDLLRRQCGERAHPAAGGTGIPAHDLVSRVQQVYGGVHRHRDQRIGGEVCEPVADQRAASYPSQSPPVTGG